VFLAWLCAAANAGRRLKPDFAAARNNLNHLQALRRGGNVR
jgi:hypothetical protein